VLKRVVLLLTLIVIIAGGVYLGIRYYKNNHIDKLILYGNVDIREVQLGFRVFGQINRLYFEEGDRVKTGDIVAELDKRILEETLAKAKADIVSKKAKAENAQRIYNRKKALVKDNYVSQESYYNAKEALDVAKADVVLSESELDIAKTNLRYATLYAPSEGVILSRIREVGTVTNPGDPVYTMALDQPIWVRAYVNEPNLGHIYYGQKVRLYSDSRPNEPYEAQVGFISPVAEFTPKSVETSELRTQLVYRLRLVIDQSDRYLRQGMPMTVEIDLGR
jgi:HlyD family secretion protein